MEGMLNRRIILVSHGLTTKVGRDLIRKELAGDCLEDKRIFLFHEPHFSIEPMLEEACVTMGFQRENILFSGRQKSVNEILTCDYLYCTEGNTYEVFSMMREHRLDQVLAEAFRRGATYIGASAGAIIAGVNIDDATVFDRNFVGMSDFRGLGLFDGIVVPHCTKEGLKLFMESNPGIAERYETIYSVGDNEILVLKL